MNEDPRTGQQPSPPSPTSGSLGRLPWLGAARKSLKISVLLVLFFEVIPTIGELLYTEAVGRRESFARARNDAERLVHLAALDHGQRMDAARQFLAVLSQIPEVRRPDPTECAALLARILRENPLYANLAVIHSDGSVACSAIPLPLGTDVVDQSFLHRVMETRWFSVGEYRIGGISARMTLDLGYPILDQAAQFRGVVYAALNLARLDEFASEARLPVGARLSVLDNRGIVLVRHPDPERLAGEIFPVASIIGAVATDEELGTTESAGVDGTEHVFAYQRVRAVPEGGEIYVVVGIPRKLYYAGCGRPSSPS